MQSLDVNPPMQGAGRGRLLKTSLVKLFKQNGCSQKKKIVHLTLQGPSFTQNLTKLKSLKSIHKLIELPKKLIDK